MLQIPVVIIYIMYMWLLIVSIPSKHSEMLKTSFPQTSVFFFKLKKNQKLNKNKKLFFLKSKKFKKKIETL